MDKPEVKKSRRAERVLKIIALLLVLASLFWLFLPELVRHTVTITLTDAGFEDISIGEIQAGVSHLELRNLRVDQITIGQVDAWYDWRSILAGRTERLLFSDVRMRPADIPVTDSSNGGIPCDTIEIKNLVCVLPDGEEVAASGELKADQFEAHLRTAAGTVDLKGDLQLSTVSGNFAFRTEGFDPGKALQLLGYTVGDLTFKEGGAYRGEGSFDRTGVTASFSSSNLIQLSVGKNVALEFNPLALEGEWRQGAKHSISVAFTSKALDATMWGEKITFEDVSISGNPLEKLAFTAKAIAWRDKRSLEPTGAFHFNKSRLEIDARIPLSFKDISKDASAILKGYIETENWSEGELVGRIPQFTVKSKESTQSFGLLVPGGYRGFASFGATIDWKLKNGTLVTPTVFNFVNATIEEKKLEIGLRGLNQTVSLTRVIEGISSDGIQVAIIDSAYSGDLKVENGEVRYKLLDSHSIFINSMKWDWAGGELSAKEVMIDTEADVITFELVVKNIRLQSFLDLFAEGKITGEGRLSGRFPVIIYRRRKQRKEPIDLGNGFLSANPPHGWFRISDDEAIRKILKDQEVLRFDDPVLSQKIQDRAELALRDFAFTRLEIEFRDREGPGWTTHFRVQGKGRQGKHPLEFGSLNININGLDHLVNPAIVMPREKREQLYSAIDKSLKDVFGD